MTNRPSIACQTKGLFVEGIRLALGGRTHRNREHVRRLSRPRSRLMAACRLSPCARAPKAGPTPEEYVAHVGGDAQLVAAGQLKLDGQQVVCGQRPTVIDNKLDDYGAAYPGFLILNPKLLSRSLDARQAVDLLARVRPPVPRAGRGDGRLFRRPARTPPAVADARGARGDVPVHHPGQGRSHALLRLAPLRRHAPVLRGPEYSLSCIGF